jgi:glycosyltransferase involved in cell wall biosynthesis
MKVLLSAFACSPGRGSEPGIGWGWATSLADLGHEVTVLTSSRFREPILAVNLPGIEFRFIDDQEPPLLGRFSSPLGMYKGYLRWQDAALRQIEAAGRRYDVAHHVSWGSLHLGSQLWRLPVPFIYGPIGGGQVSPVSYWRFFGREWAAETLRTASTSLLVLSRRTRETIRNSAVTLACNSDTAAVSRRLGGADVRYMLADGLPRDWVVAARPRPAGVPVVLWVGSLIPRKAPILAVQAFAELRRAMPARLVMVGDGPLREQLHTAVERIGLAGDIDLLGRVTWDDVRRLYDSASVFLFTSLRDSFGCQFMEALGRGLPAVALNHHGIANVEAGPAAVKVALPRRPRDLPGRLASALQTVLGHDEWALRSAAASDWAAGQVWPAKAASATQIYWEVVRARSGLLAA